MVSAVWFAWSKCPPLHPCCHCGSQAGQNNPESNSPSIYFTILSACRPVAASLHGSVPYRIFFFAPVKSFHWVQICHGGTLLLFELTLLNFWSLSPKTHTHTHTHKLLLPLCTTPSVLCLTLLICQPLPPHSFELPASSCPCGIVEWCSH